MHSSAPALTQVTARAALRDVIDLELGFNIVDLGLVYDIAIEDGIVDVRMTMTTPVCPAQDHIVNGVGRRLAQHGGTTGIFVGVVWDPTWSSDLMSAVAKAHFRIGGHGRSK